MSLYTYRWYEYDVWGNRRDGYQVNDVFRTPEVYMVDPDWSDPELIRELRKQNFFKKGVRSNLIEIDGDEEKIYFDYKGRPEGELRREEESGIE